jgi:hypothetical protein
MRITVLLLLASFASLLKLQALDNSAALEKLQRIPLAPNGVENLPRKSVPVVTVKAQGVFINDSKTPIPFDRVLDALSRLPRSSWPYGRAIIFWRSPPSVYSSNEEPSPEASKKVEANLNKAHIHFMDNEVST